jgi:hypothetical protein
MSVATYTRTATVDEIASEMDRRGVVIEKLEAELAKLKSSRQWEYRSATGDWHSCRSMADAMMWAEDGREIRLSKA